MGNADNDKSGYRTRLLQGQGLTTLQPLFSNLDDAQIRLSSLILDGARENYTPGKIRTMLEGEEPSPYFYLKNFAKYHCTVELGYDTESQKQMQFLQLMQLREQNVQVPDEDIINAATIQNKTEILERMSKRREQADKMQEMQMQLQMQQAQAQIESLKAQAAANIGLGHERDSRVFENYALQHQRDAQALKDREQAISEHHRDEEASILNFIKAAKEIRGIDIEHIAQILQISRDMNQEREPLSPGAAT
jgi:hypothetical protein